LTARVALVEFDTPSASLKQAIRMTGGIDDLNVPDRTVVVKVGIFSHKAESHTSVNVVDAIIKSFSKAPSVFIAESDNYKGPGLERLQIYKELFNKQVAPLNLSCELNTRKVRLADQEMTLSNALFKPNIFVSTHILRTYEKGSILKNLLGCTQTPKKAKFHKDKVFAPLLADIYEAVGGIDLAVLDGTCIWHKGESRAKMNILIVGRDAVAVETIGALLAGLKPEKSPVIQEFAKRGLGEADARNIEVLGTDLASLKQKCKSAIKTLDQEPRMESATRRD